MKTQLEFVLKQLDRQWVTRFNEEAGMNKGVYWIAATFTPINLNTGYESVRILFPTQENLRIGYHYMLTFSVELSTSPENVYMMQANNELEELLK